MQENDKKSRPVIIGEVLFDDFGESRVLGGAPFNVAWNLQGFGLSPLFLSAVGADNDGEEIRQRMKEWGMDLAGLQKSQEFPTGKVKVELDGSQPTFHILDQQAYDDIQQPVFEISPQNYRLLYLGTLAYRNNPTRKTMQHLIANSGLPRFVDINIRRPWFDEAWLPALLNGASWVKLNDDELATLAGSPCETAEQIQAACQQVRSKFGGEQFFVTCGASGVYAMDSADEMYFAPAPQPEPMRDTVGAGDAFAAAAIFGICQGTELQNALETAARFASKTCTLQGATTTDKQHYAGFAG